jgi:hypothetical protein
VRNVVVIGRACRGGPRRRSQVFIRAQPASRPWPPYRGRSQALDEIETFLGECAVDHLRAAYARGARRTVAKALAGWRRTRSRLAQGVLIALGCNANP